MRHIRCFPAKFNEEGGLLENNAHGESMQMLNITLSPRGAMIS